MLTRAADFLKKGVFPVSRAVGAIGVVVLVLMVLLIIAEVIARRALDAPIAGRVELTSLSLILVVFLTLAYCAAKGGHIEMDILTSRFPKRAQAGIGTLIHLLTTGMLGVASWQLVVHGMKIQDMQQTSGVLAIEIYPFLYMAALGGTLLTLVYLIYFLYSLDEVRK